MMEEITVRLRTRRRDTLQEAWSWWEKFHDWSGEYRTLYDMTKPLRHRNLEGWMNHAMDKRKMFMMRPSQLPLHIRVNMEDEVVYMLKYHNGEQIWHREVLSRYEKYLEALRTFNQPQVSLDYAVDNILQP
jgi:hypothetical protein